MPDLYAQQWDDLVKGDAASWKKLYKEGFDYTFRRLGRKVYYEEKDDVFTAAFHCFQDKLLSDKIKREYAPVAFLKGIIRFKCVEFWRRKNSGKPEPGGENPGPEDPPGNEGLDSPEFHEERVHACFQELHQDCQQILLLTIYEKKSHLEVAEIMGISSKFVRVKKHRCMNYLKSCMSRKNA